MGIISGVLHFGPARDKVKATYKPQIFKMAYFFINYLYINK